MADVNETMVQGTKILSGESVEFNTPREVNIKSLKVYFSPKQSGEGTPSPENVRPIEGWTKVQVGHRGKNLCITELYQITQRIGTVEVLPNRDIKVFGGLATFGYPITMESGQSATFSLRLNYIPKKSQIIQIVYKSHDNNTISSVTAGYMHSDSGSITYTASETATYLFTIRARYYEDEAPNGEVILSNWQVEYGTEATAYEPPFYNVYTIDWENELGTLYGGYVDFVSGEVVETYRKYEFTGNENFGWHGWGDDIYIVNRETGTNPKVPFYSSNKDYCNMYSTIFRRLQKMPVGYFSIVGENSVPNYSYIIFNNTSLGETKEECVEKIKEFYNNGTPLTVVAPLKNVYQETYQFSPQSLTALPHTNHFFTTADRIEIEYEFVNEFNPMESRKNIMKGTPHLESLSGNFLEFGTDMGVGLKECKVYFKPIQEGDGVPSPDNIRNIRGWDEVNLWHDPQESGMRLIPIDFQEQTSDFGTIYGGYIDLLKGELVQEWEIINLSTVNWLYTSSNNRFYKGGYNNYDLGSIQSVKPDIYCNTYEVVPYASVSGSTVKDCVFSSNSGYLTIRDTRYTDPTEFKSYLASIGAVACAKLKTPIVHSLTLQQISTFQGTNKIWTDSNDSIELSYWKHGDDAFQYVPVEALTSNDNFIIVTDDGYVIGDEHDYIKY